MPSAREILIGDGTTSMVFPAIVTPLNEKGQVDEDSTRRLIQHLYTQGIGGLYICGSTGEGLYLDRETRQYVEAQIGLTNSNCFDHANL